MRYRMVVSSRKRKEESRKLFEKLLREYSHLIIIDASGLRAKLLDEIRRLSKEYGFIIKGGKNGVFIKALEAVSKDLSEDLKKHIKGQNIFLFTNEDMIDLALKLSKLEVDLPASPGDIAVDDIVIPAGNTGIPPGPVIGLFSALGLQTRIMSGTIHIMKETVAAKKGERISMELANLLSKLGITPIKAKVNFKFGYDLKNKLYYPIELLIPDMEEIREALNKAVLNAFHLAIETEYPEPTILTILIQRAYINAKTLAIESGYISKETVPILISKAIAVAKALEEAISA